MVNEDEKEQGQERVFMRYTWTPGCIVTRSLGDELAHQCVSGISFLVILAPVTVE